MTSLWTLFSNNLRHFKWLKKRREGLNLGDAILMRNHGHDIVQGEETVALDFRVHVLAHGAQSQQPNQLDVIP